jgi:hypothetical protein
MTPLRVPRPIGRPRSTPEVVLADKAYWSRAIRTHLRRRGIRAVIPQPSDQAAKRKKRGRSGGRPPAFDREAYKRRNTFERCINSSSSGRGLATPLRQDRHHPPGRTPRRRHLHLVGR